MDILSEEIKKMKSSLDYGLNRRLLVYEGNPGCGKTRLVSALHAAAEKNKPKVK